MLDPSWFHVISVNPLPLIITSEVTLKCEAGDTVPYRFSGDKIISCQLQEEIWTFDENQGEPTCTPTGGKRTGGKRMDLMSYQGLSGSFSKNVCWRYNCGKR